jgi:hypothetical protein
MLFFTSLLLAAFAALSFTNEFGPTFKLSPDQINNTITYVETTIQLTRSPDYSPGNISLYPAWYGEQGLVRTTFADVTITKRIDFGCGDLEDGEWCAATYANVCNDQGCQDVYGAKTPVSGTPSVNGILTNVTIRNSIDQGTNNVLQELIWGGKTISNLTTRRYS